MSKDKFDYFIKGEKNKYEVIIGLEVHAQVSSNSKLFSGSATKFFPEDLRPYLTPSYLAKLEDASAGATI